MVDVIRVSCGTVGLVDYLLPVERLGYLMLYSGMSLLLDPVERDNPSGIR